MPNQPMYKIAQNVPSGTKAIVNKIQNVQQYFLQLALLVRGRKKIRRKKSKSSEKNTLVFIAQDYLSNLHAVLSFN